MMIADLLLVEDNPGDVGLVRKALQRCRIANELNVVGDGVEAMKYLRREPPYTSARVPHLVLLDLNLPRKDGREVLKEIKEDPQLCSIPVVVLTSSQAEIDILRSYELHANSFMTKPPTLQRLQDMMMALHNYWFAIVKLPPLEA